MVFLVFFLHLCSRTTEVRRTRTRTTEVRARARAFGSSDPGSRGNIRNSLASGGGTGDRGNVGTGGSGDQGNSVSAPGGRGTLDPDAARASGARGDTGHSSAGSNGGGTRDADDANDPLDDDSLDDDATAHGAPVSTPWFTKIPGEEDPHAFTIGPAVTPWDATAHYNGPTSADWHERSNLKTLYKEIYRGFMSFSQTLEPRTVQDAYERIRGRSTPSMLVCAYITRPGPTPGSGARISEPVLMVVGAPTPAGCATDPSCPWADPRLTPENDIAATSAWHLWLGTVEFGTRQGTLPAVSQRTIEQYLQRAVFHLSSDGELVQRMAVRAKHDKQLDYWLGRDQAAKTALYGKQGEITARTTGYDKLSQDADKRGATVAFLPRCVPLPAGCPLPPGFIGSATMGSKRLTDALELLLGPAGREIGQLNLIREWADAVAEFPHEFAARWALVLDYPNLFATTTAYSTDAMHDAMCQMTLRFCWRVHLDALDPSRVPNVLEFVARAGAAAEFTTEPVFHLGGPPFERVEMLGIFSPRSQKLLKLLAAFVRSAWSPPSVFNYVNRPITMGTTAIKQSLLQRTGNALPAQLKDDREESDDEEDFGSDDDGDDAIGTAPAVTFGQPRGRSPLPYRDARRSRSASCSPDLSRQDRAHYASGRTRPPHTAAATRDTGRRRERSPSYEARGSPYGRPSRQRRRRYSRSRSRSATPPPPRRTGYRESVSSRDSTPRRRGRTTTREQRAGHYDRSRSSRRGRSRSSSNSSSGYSSIDAYDRRRSQRRERRSPSPFRSRDEEYQLLSPARHYGACSPRRRPRQYPDEPSTQRQSTQVKQVAEFYSVLLGVCPATDDRFYEEERCKTRLPNSKLLRPAHLRPALDTDFVTASDSQVRNNLDTYIRRISTQQRGAHRTAPKSLHSLPLDLVKALRNGQFRCAPDDTPTTQHFSPMALLVLHSTTTGSNSAIRMPAEGLSFDEAMALATLYVYMLDYLTDEDSSELCTTIRRLMERLDRGWNPATNQGIAHLWNSSTDHRISCTYQFLMVLNSLTHAHALIHDQYGRKTERRQRVFRRGNHRSERSREMLLLQTCYAENFAPVFPPGTSNYQVTVTEATVHICNEYMTLFRTDYRPTVGAIPAAIYTPPAASTKVARRPQNSNAGDETNEGKQKKKQQKSAKVAFVMELLASKEGSGVFVKRQLLSQNDGKSPNIVSGTKTTALCLRSCGTALGTCKDSKNCNFFHFEPDAQAPPSDIDLSDLKRFLDLPGVKKVVEPTELGKKVFGM